MSSEPLAQGENLPSPAPIGRAEFFALYTRHSRQLYGFIRTLVPNQADADDAFQEVSAILWEKFDSFEPGSNFLGWAMRTAHFCALRYHSRARRRPISLTSEFLDAVATESAGMRDLLEAQHRALADCYARLSPENREMLDRRYREGVSVKQLAEDVGRPLRTVYRLLEHVHMSLMKCIDAKLDGGPL